MNTKLPNPFVVLDDNIPSQPANTQQTNQDVYAAAPPISNASDSFQNARESNKSHSTVVKGNGLMLLICHSVKEKENVSNEMNSQIVYPNYPFGYCMASPVPQKIKHTSKVTEKDKFEVLCNGTVDVLGKERISYDDGSVKDLVWLQIFAPAGTAVNVQVSQETLQNPKSLKKQLEVNGIIIHKPEKLSCLCEYLSAQMRVVSSKETHKGFSISENRILHSDEDKILQSACEVADCKTRFGLEDKRVNLANGALLLIDSYAEIRQPLDWIKHKANPIIVLKCDDIDAAKDVLKKAFPDVTQIALGRNLEKNLESVEGNLAFIIADSASTYFADKLIEILDKSGSAGSAKINCLPIVVTVSDNLFKRESNRIIGLKLDNSLGENSNRVAFWFMKRLISESGFLTMKTLSNNYERFSSLLDSDARLNDISAPFFAALLAIFDFFVSSWELDAENHRRIVETMTDYLINTNEGGTDSIVERLKSVIMKNRETPVFDRVKCRDISPNGIVLVDNEKISLDNNSFAKFSELCKFEKPRNFAEALKAEGLLLTDGKLQKKVSLPNAKKSENMYCIALGKLFEYGEQIPETDEYAYGAPEVQLRLGNTNEGNPLYFTLNKTDGSQNANVYISGSSGCGKSTLLRQWARESARNGLETVIIDTDGQFAQAMKSEDVLVYSIGEEYGISSSASGKTLIAAANASVGLTGKQKNKLKELSCSFNKCNTLNELFASFAEKVSEDESGILDNVCEALKESGVTNGKALDWNDICCKEVISVLDFSALDVPNIKPLLDLILGELFAHKMAKKEDGVVTCTLILDEVQNFNLDGNSPLAASFLRQGRKLGISAVLATQYLSSDDAKNIGKLLKQCESFCSFKPANASDTLKLMNLEKSDAAECCLNNLETGSAVVKGAFSTDKCSIKYPVVLFVENDE